MFFYSLIKSFFCDKSLEEKYFLIKIRNLTLSQIYSQISPENLK